MSLALSAIALQWDELSVSGNTNLIKKQTRILTPMQYSAIGMLSRLSRMSWSVFHSYCWYRIQQKSLGHCLAPCWGQLSLAQDLPSKFGQCHESHGDACRQRNWGLVEVIDLFTEFPRMCHWLLAKGNGKSRRNINLQGLSFASLQQFHCIIISNYYDVLRCITMY